MALNNMKTALWKKHKILKFTGWDQKFHQLLTSLLPETKRLETVYDQLDCQQMLFISTILDDRDLAARSLQEHTQILWTRSAIRVPIWYTHTLHHIISILKIVSYLKQMAEPIFTFRQIEEFVVSNCEYPFDQTLFC